MSSPRHNRNLITLPSRRVAVAALSPSAQDVVPIAVFITLDIVKTAQAKFIDNDLQMKDSDGGSAVTGACVCHLHESYTNMEIAGGTHQQFK
jgi:hypothetical protein